MTPEHDLGTLLRAMDPELVEGIFVFVALPASHAAPPAWAGLSPVMTFREREGLTLVLREEDALAAGLTGTYRCRLITLNVRSALTAVGFLAVITTALAEAGISVNAASAFHHDHLFVPVERADEVMTRLRNLAAR
jgi:hypothetical protein